MRSHRLVNVGLSRWAVLKDVEAAPSDRIELRLKNNQRISSCHGPLAMVAARLAKMPAHRPSEDNSANLRTSGAASALSVSERFIETARKVERTDLQPSANLREVDTPGAARALSVGPQPVRVF